jgi:hypothetical protein
MPVSIGHVEPTNGEVPSNVSTGYDGGRRGRLDAVAHRPANIAPLACRRCANYFDLKNPDRRVRG